MIMPVTSVCLSVWRAAPVMIYSGFSLVEIFVTDKLADRTRSTLRDPCGSNQQWRKNILETLSITTLLAGQQQKHLASNYAATGGRNDF